MKLLTDLFACQTGSRFRGIGRYTRALFDEMIRQKGQHQIVALANSLYPESFEALRQHYTRILPISGFLPYRHPPLSVQDGKEDPNEEAAATLARHAYQLLNPDAVLYPSVFEGWLEQGVVPLPKDGFPKAVNAAILYDFIPYVFQDRFLDPNPNYQRFYMKRMAALKDFDLLLAISESTRRDAIRFLNLDPEKVVNISAAADPIFRKITIPVEEHEPFLRKMGITKPFIFYNGNVEYHKNLSMALRAFARQPRAVREAHQFVLTKSGGAQTLLKMLCDLGIEESEVVEVGYIDDDTLIRLYNLCEVLIFPSLYEGFGLPVLEAMACGAPVIAANNSSIPEVLNREDALFDANSEDSTAALLERALTDAAFRRELSVYGLKRAKEFGWEKCARSAWGALEGAVAGKKGNRSAVFAPPAKPKRKVAYLSPLPPQQSGIADYSADLLPYLAEQVDIDLFVEDEKGISHPNIDGKFKLFSWEELPKLQDTYDVVMYQFGNSYFHAHMVNLLRDIPGVVVLHDFYLSNIARALTQTSGRPQLLAQLIDQDHGTAGKIDLVVGGADGACKTWPVNRAILQNAQEVIIHSEHQNAMFARFYYDGWQPRRTVIRQLRSIPAETSTAEREALRNALGIAVDKIVICSFGMMAPTKRNEDVIAAFAHSEAARSGQALLIFVGEEERGAYGAQLQAMIQTYALGDTIRITGFVDTGNFETYLKIADMAVQLRTQTRGETSRALLDCMAYGIPTIINAHGSFTDYPDEAVYKLPDSFTEEELKKAIDFLAMDAAARAQLGQRAQEEIRARHDPRAIARDYAVVIEHAYQTSEQMLFAPLIDVLEHSSEQEKLTQTFARHAAENRQLRSGCRILIDVSDIAGTDWKGGIQRVVKSILRQWLGSPQAPAVFEPVRISEGTLLRAFRFTERLLELPAGSLGKEEAVSLRPGDTLLMLDSSWNQYFQYGLIFDEVRRLGGKIATMVYDLIPILHPAMAHQEVLNVYTRWLHEAIAQSDVLIGISKAVIDDLNWYMEKHRIGRDRPVDLAFIHLGSDVVVPAGDVAVRPIVHQLTGITNSPFFLMVSTIEPRKGFGLVLDAFERLWQQGQNLRLCFIGKIGWNVEDLERRLRNHPELDKRLYFIENATDAEVNLCYASATALIAASIAEGFGLPIVEAARYHVPVIASDIPVFREVGRDGPEYFSLDSPTQLAEAVVRVANKSETERRAMAERVPVLTWEQSAAWLLAILHGKEGRHPADAQPEPQPPSRARRAWLYAPGITSEERADLQQRLAFYAPGITDVQILEAGDLDKAAASSNPVLQYCPAEELPAELQTLGQRVFFVDSRHHNEDAYEWARLATFLAEDLDYTAAHERFLAFYHQLRAENLTKAYLFGTGPSLERAIECDWSDGYRIVCNTIVRDPALWKHIQPHFIVAADSRYHFGHTAFSRAFRKDLHERLRETETYFLYPGVFDAIAQREFADVRERLLPLPYGAQKRIDVDLSVDYETPGLGNVLPLMLLPLGCTLAKHVCLWGFDGRGPSDNLFWKNSNRHNYPELMPEMMKAHPAFFESYMPKRGTNTYVQQFMGDELDQLMTDAEGRGYRFEMLHPTWTETLQKRIVDPSIPRVPEQNEEGAG